MSIYENVFLMAHGKDTNTLPGFKQFFTAICEQGRKWVITTDKVEINGKFSQKVYFIRVKVDNQDITGPLANGLGLKLTPHGKIALVDTPKRKQLPTDLVYWAWANSGRRGLIIPFAVHFKGKFCSFDYSQRQAKAKQDKIEYEGRIARLCLKHSLYSLTSENIEKYRYQYRVRLVLFAKNYVQALENFERMPTNPIAIYDLAQCRKAYREVLRYGEHINDKELDKALGSIAKAVKAL